jgi:hypothetical protein
MDEDIRKELDRIAKRAEAMRGVFELRPGPCTGSELAALAAQVNALAVLMQRLAKAPA